MGVGVGAWGLRGQGAGVGEDTAATGGRPLAGPHREGGRSCANQQNQIVVALRCMVDGVVVGAACLAAWFLRTAWITDPAKRWWPKSWENYFKEPLILFAVPIVLFTMWCMGLYRPRRDRSLWS